MGGLDTAYRPVDFDEVIGNEDIKNSLASIFGREQEKVPHAFLFHGPKGCGKTSIGRIVASKLGAYSVDREYNPDFREYNASSFRGIDTIREIAQDCMYAPVQSPCIVYLMDEVHMLTKEAKEAFLKLLEEPPIHVYFILCTTEPQNLTETIRSRCVKFEVKVLRRDDIYQLLTEVVASEFEDSSAFPDSVIVKIAEKSEGVPRDALNLLETVIDIEDEKKALEILESAFIAEASIKDLIQTMIDGTLTVEGRWKKMQGILTGLKDQRGQNDPEKMRRGILDYLTKVLLTTNDHLRIAKIANYWTNNFYSSGESGLRLAAYLSCMTK